LDDQRGHLAAGLTDRRVPDLAGGGEVHQFMPLGQADVLLEVGAVADAPLAVREVPAHCVLLVRRSLIQGSYQGSLYLARGFSALPAPSGSPGLPPRGGARCPRAPCCAARR